MDCIRDNGEAYEKWEIRNGAPLGYVAEKLRAALESAHEIVQSIHDLVPDDLPQPRSAVGTSFSAKTDGLLSPALAAFHYSLIAFLGLHNRLNLANETQLEERLLADSGETFRLWLSRMKRESTASG